ncbi:hypothetical protein SALBM311S_10681 [Streptomyces alboniger]
MNSASGGTHSYRRNPFPGLSLRRPALQRLAHRRRLTRTQLDRPAHRLRQHDDQDDPAREGSRLLRLGGDNPVYDSCARPVELEGDTVRFMVTGSFTDADLGVACYHSKTGAVELFLNHLVDGPDEYVVVDMTAGSDSFASGMFTRFDITFLVAEPTRKGVSVYRQYKEYARDFCVVLKTARQQGAGPGRPRLPPRRSLGRPAR